MKKIITFFVCISLAPYLFCQIPDLQIEDPSGNFINLPDYLEDDRIYGLIIWSVQDPPSTAALEDYHNYYDDWVNAYDIEFLIVSIDEESLHNDVTDYVDQQSWSYTLFFSPSAEVMQAFGINTIPYIYLIDMNQEIAFETAGWLQGDLLDQEIEQLFTVGLEENHGLSNLQVYAAENQVVIETTTIQAFLAVSIYAIDGKLLYQHAYTNQASNQISVNTNHIPKGTIVIVRIETGDGRLMCRKIKV